MTNYVDRLHKYLIDFRYRVRENSRLGSHVESVLLNPERPTLYGFHYCINIYIGVLCCSTGALCKFKTPWNPIKEKMSRDSNKCFKVIDFNVLLVETEIKVCLQLFGLSLVTFCKLVHHDIRLFVLKYVHNTDSG